MTEEEARQKERAFTEILESIISTIADNRDCFSENAWRCAQGAREMGAILEKEKQNVLLNTTLLFREELEANDLARELMDALARTFGDLFYPDI